MYCGLVGFLLTGCENPVTWQEDTTPGEEDPELGEYRFGHFMFLYDTRYFSSGRVVDNGKAKEAHLERINSELGVAFDGTIIVRLTSDLGPTRSGEAYSNHPYFISESWNYFVQDNGHEIAHIISFETLGFPGPHRFYVEGLAAAHELDSQPKLARLCRYLWDEEELAALLVGQGEVRRSELVNYDLAAAFVEWLEQEFGMEAFKTFYRELEQFPASSLSSLSSLYERNFGLDQSGMHRRFIRERYLKLKGSQACD
jgi:hypothetical protein